MILRTTLPTYKRVFDIAVSASLIIVLSPVLLAIAVCIRLESKGPVFYYSKRVGRNYQVFNFYKFRSMVIGADKLMSSLKTKNQYKSAEVSNNFGIDLTRKTIIKHGLSDVMVDNSTLYFAKNYAQVKSAKNKASFVKIINDPRITRFGKFIRKTSLDELPQLFNVLFGHMSIVGNRPLPLYEAEKLITDDAVGRFLGPAGITGLWQVTERGKRNVTPESRIALDIKYAQEYNMLLDLKILLKTPVAALQQENV